MAEAEPGNERRVTTVGDMVVDEQDYYAVLPIVQLFYDYLHKAFQDEGVIDELAEEGVDHDGPPTFTSGAF